MNRKVHDTCTFAGCDRKHVARGYCNTHYMQFKRGVALVPILERIKGNFPQCRVSWCSQPAEAQDLCKTHLARSAPRESVNRAFGVSAEKCRLCESVVWSKGLCDNHYQFEARWKKFGFTADDYEDLLRRQDYRCVLCGTPDGKIREDSSIKRRLSVDHCHETNVIRGLLCDGCNRGLGLLQDNTDILRKAIVYIEQHRPQEVVDLV